jgi:hypothetical protein
LAYYRESSFCTVRAVSSTTAITELKLQVEEILYPQARAWHNEWRGRKEAPNCPEGAIRLPIDSWVCKLTDKTCPLQAQVFLQAREEFFKGCLASQDRKRQIFNTVVQGKYDGFHHIPGRFLCKSCEKERKKLSFRYHYPWELTFVTAYYPFDLEQDWPTLLKKFGNNNISLSTVVTGMCASHCKQLAEKLDPAVAAELFILEIELER